MLLKKSPASKTRPRETSHRFRPLNRTLASKSPRSLGQRLFARRRRKTLQNSRTRRGQSNRPLLRLRLCRRRRVPRCQCPSGRSRPRTNFVWSRGDRMTSVLVGRKFWNGLWLPRRRWPNYSASVDLVIREWHLVAKRNEIKHSARVVFY
jgi:hypothetical protein